VRAGPAAGWRGAGGGAYCRGGRSPGGTAIGPMEAAIPSVQPDQANRPVPEQEPILLRSAGADGVAVLTLNRPERRNSLSVAMLDALRAALAEIAADPGAFRAAVAAVQEGKCVVVYPEGTITRDPGLWPMVGKTGAARIALSTSAPVVPVAQWGPQHILAPYAARP